MGQVQVSKAKVHSNQIIAIVEIVFAGILLFIFSMGVIAGITERIWGMFWSFLVFCVLGGLLLSCGVRRRSEFKQRPPPDASKHIRRGFLLSLPCGAIS